MPETLSILLNCLQGHQVSPRLVAPFHAAELHAMIGLRELQAICLFYNECFTHLIRQKGASLCSPHTCPSFQQTFRNKMSATFCLVGLARVQWITLPLAEIDGALLGVSLVSRFGSNAWLLEQAMQLDETTR